MSPTRYEIRACLRSSGASELPGTRSTPRSCSMSRADGFMSSHTMVRREPPKTVVRIFVGLSQLTCTCASAPVDSQTDR